MSLYLEIRELVRKRVKKYREPKKREKILKFIIYKIIKEKWQGCEIRELSTWYQWL